MYIDKNKHTFIIHYSQIKCRLYVVHLLANHRELRHSSPKHQNTFLMR